MIDIVLPMPPSANALWRGTGARVVKSAPYKAWQVKAGYVMQMAKVRGELKAVIGSYMLLLAIPPSMRGDLDNRHKAVNDLFQRMGIVPDDKHCDCLFVTYSDDVAKDTCRAVIGKRTDILDFTNPHPLVRAGGCGPKPLPLPAGAEAA